MPTNNDNQKPKDLVIAIPMGRLSYPQVFIAKAMKNPDGSMGKAKFSTSILLDKKEHAATIKQIEKMIERAMLDKFGKKVALKNVCLHDGNEKEDKDGYGDDVMYVTAKSDTRPEVVDQKGVRLNEEDGRIYGGCYADVSIGIFAYKHPMGGSGVSAQLRAIRFRKDGESFGGGGPVDASKEFAGIPADEGDEAFD